MPKPLPPLLLWPLALAVGLALFWLSDFIDPAVPATLNFGTDFATMAASLPDLVGSFPHRVLSPLLGRGIEEMAARFGVQIPYWRFAHGCSVLFLAVLFVAAHRLGARPWPALLLTASIAGTGTLLLYKGHVGYPEPMTFTLLLATMLAANSAPWFWFWQLLNLLQHEQVLFFWPWLLWWRRQRGGDWRADLIGLALVVGVYYGFRHYVGRVAIAPAAAGAVRLTFGHYTETLGKYFPVGTLGLAALNLVCTFIYFGFWPIVLIRDAVRRGAWRGAFPLLLFIFCQHAIFAVAHDTYRFTCFLFVPVLLAGARLAQERHGAWLVLAFGAATTLAYLPQRYVFVDLAIRVQTDTDANGVPFVRPDIVGDIVPKVIPAMPWTFASYGLCLLASVVAGIWWSRRSPPALGDGAGIDVASRLPGSDRTV